MGTGPIVDSVSLDQFIVQRLGLSASLLVETLNTVDNSTQVCLNLFAVGPHPPTSTRCHSRDEFSQAFPNFCHSFASMPETVNSCSWEIPAYQGLQYDKTINTCMDILGLYVAA